MDNYKGIYDRQKAYGADSACDLCERETCIGVDECKRAIGDNYWWVKRTPSATIDN